MSFSSQTVYEEAAEGQTWGQTMGGGVIFHQQETFSSGKLREG